MDWAEFLPEDIELQIVQLPGREERLREPLITDMTELVEKITRELLPLTDQPHAFFGHSMGAMVCFEVARELRAIGAPLPKHLFLSSRAAPHLQDHSEPLRFLGNEKFVDRLHELYGAVPGAIRQSAELRDVFLPILRADVALLETHQFVEVEPLDCSISVFGGDKDPAISNAMLEGWKTMTSASFHQHAYRGGHFYLQAEPRVVVSEVDKSLATPDIR